MQVAETFEESDTDVSLSLQSEELLEALSLPPLILLCFTATVKQNKKKTILSTNTAAVIQQS